MSSITEKKYEALSRMVTLHLHPQVISDFKNGIVCCSVFDGARQYLDGYRKELVSDFEKIYGCMVYHVIRNYTIDGEMLSFLYVSDDKKEWIKERSETELLSPFAYVSNVDFDSFSEFGGIRIKTKNGGLIRVA